MLVRDRNLGACAGWAIALVALAGCSSKTQLRVVVHSNAYREGTLFVAARTWQTDPAPALQFPWTDPNRSSASFLFQFGTHSGRAFLTVVTTHFQPTHPNPNECLFDCEHWMTLRPGHSYRFDTPIISLPRPCPAGGGEDLTAATDICAEVNSQFTIPNCQFMVLVNPTRCGLVCLSEPPEDPSPDDPADVTGQQSQDWSGTPNEPPVPSDAGDGGSHIDAAYDNGAPDVVSSIDVPDVPPTPIVCGGFANDCDGRFPPGSCYGGQVCVGGRCLSPCVEGACNSGQTCVSGVCVDSACVSVVCPPNLVCYAGACVDPCAM
jgi:hypothetical protein